MNAPTGQFNLGIHGKLRNYSSGILVAGTSQLLLAASSNWNYIFIANPSSAIESFWLGFTDDAFCDYRSMEVMPGQFLNFRTPGFITDERISIAAPTFGHLFTCYAF